MGTPDKNQKGKKDDKNKKSGSGSDRKDGNKKSPTKK